MVKVTEDIKGFLFDLDGTLYVSDKAINGAVETISKIKSKNIPCRFITNTTTRTQKQVHKKIISFGFDISENEIFTPLTATHKYLESLGSPSCNFVLNDNIIAEFKQFETNQTNPDYIIIGDIGNNWSYDLLNILFNQIMNGARIIALHKGRYWQERTGLQLDIGAFVAGLEYASSTEAIIIGKPSLTFYQAVLKEMDIKKTETAMVGDDILNDIKGAQEAGMTGILVKTGKYREEWIAKSGVLPDLVIDSVADLLK